MLFEKNSFKTLAGETHSGFFDLCVSFGFRLSHFLITPHTLYFPGSALSKIALQVSMKLLSSSSQLYNKLLLLKISGNDSLNLSLIKTLKSQ